MRCGFRSPDGADIISGEKMCTRYQALPDLIQNIFRDEQIQILTVSYDWYDKTTEEKVYLKLGESLGRNKKETRRAYSQAKKYQESWLKAKEKKQLTKLENKKIKCCWRGIRMYSMTPTWAEN